jgi:thiol-disulfide isomerase/thioredoxin
MRRALAFAALLAVAVPAFAEAPVVQVVFVTADWCPNCAALRPELATAISRVEGVARVDIDVTNAARRAHSRETAIANGLLAQHDAWVGRTGFAALVDPETHRTLGCVTSSYKAPEIEGALRRAVSNARNRGPGAERPLRLSACPS